MRSATDKPGPSCELAGAIISGIIPTRLPMCSEETIRDIGSREMRPPFYEYPNFLLCSVLAAFAVFAVLAVFMVSAAIILGIAVFAGANYLWFHNNRLDKYEEFIPVVLSIYHTAVYEDQLSHDLALAKIAEYRYPDSETMQQRLLKDAKELDDLWPELSRGKLAQFVDRDSLYLELTRQKRR